MGDWIKVSNMFCIWMVIMCAITVGFCILCICTL